MATQHGDRDEVALLASAEMPHWAGLHDHQKRVAAIREVAVGL